MVGKTKQRAGSKRNVKEGCICARCFPEDGAIVSMDRSAKEEDAWGIMKLKLIGAMIMSACIGALSASAKSIAVSILAAGIVIGIILFVLAAVEEAKSDEQIHR